MSRRHRHRTARDKVSNRAEAEAATPERIGALLAQGKPRLALDAAKELNKREPTAQTESLLIDAYLARVRELLGKGMAAEAHALLDLARSRHPALASRHAELLDLQLLNGELNDFLRPLANPGLDAGQRMAIEDALRRRLLDPAKLADCEALPADHALRRGAAEATRALKAAASRPVSEEEIALPEISRRSPLAPWKLLARAIAAFHRNEDAACEQTLSTIEADSAPGRLAPLFRAMLAGDWSGGTLANRIAGRAEELRASLEELDTSFQSYAPPKRTLELIRRAIKTCREQRPDLLDVLRQRISVRAMMEGAPAQLIEDAIGGASRKDAAFWLLFARAQEMRGPDHFLVANIAWDRFVQHGLAEGWLNDHRKEPAAVYRHMAGLFKAVRGNRKYLSRLHYEASPFLHEIFAYYKGQPAEVRAAGNLPANGRIDTYMFYPELLYEKSCALDPRNETFREWLEWARKSDGQTGDAVAEAWHRALPDQPAPLLELTKSAERRGALKKALGYLERAEQLDGLNPDVRRSRWRLLVHTALNHFKQKKPHLASKDLAAMESLDMAREGDRPILLAILQGWLAFTENDERGFEDKLNEAERLAGESPGVAMAALGIAEQAGLLREANRALDGRLRLDPSTALVDSYLRASAMLEEAGFSLRPAEASRDALIGLIRSAEYRGAASRMVLLARTALKASDPALAYAAAGVGLSRGDGPEVACLLLLRALSLPRQAWIRRENCVLGALQLARERNDAELAAEALDAWRIFEAEFYGPMLAGGGADKEELELDQGHLERVVAHERAATAYPQVPAVHNEEDNYLADCPCERCRDEFGAGPQKWEDPFDEFECDEPIAPPRTRDNRERPARKNRNDPPAQADMFDEELFGEDAFEDEDLYEEDVAGDEFVPPPDMPLEMLPILARLMAKYERRDGTLPPIEELLEREPAIARKMLELMEAHERDSPFAPGMEDGEGGGWGGGPPPFDDFLPPRRRSKTMRKRKKRKKR